MRKDLRENGERLDHRVQCAEHLGLAHAIWKGLRDQTRLFEIQEGAGGREQHDEGADTQQVRRPRDAREAGEDTPANRPLRVLGAQFHSRAGACTPAQQNADTEQAQSQKSGGEQA